MIRELRKNITLGGLRIKDLITEGRKYWMPAHRAFMSIVLRTVGSAPGQFLTIQHSQICGKIA